MKELLDCIEKQLAFNRDKNLFYDEAAISWGFTRETIAAIERLAEIDTKTENLLIEHVTNRVLQEFCRVNQYYSFNKQDRKDLRDIYANLVYNIRDPETTIEITTENHCLNLKKWLVNVNAFAETMYVSKDEFVEPVTCHEYSAELQLKILQIDLKNITAPVLDIGCGTLGNLVKYLRRNGIEAYGCDRFAEASPFLSCQDWFDYQYGTEKWGTITSNLGFSNHFNHHHLRNDGNFIEYAKTFMIILNSLKVEGSFHYAPGLPFIENLLDKSKFELKMQNVSDHMVKSVIIKRLK